jgi:hypothetical protein
MVLLKAGCVLGNGVCLVKDKMGGANERSEGEKRYKLKTNKRIQLYQNVKQKY